VRHSTVAAPLGCESFSVGERHCSNHSSRVEDHLFGNSGRALLILSTFFVLDNYVLTD
jgi:hypothetical protein